MTILKRIRKIAGKLRVTLHKGDSIYRYGGEEFLNIWPEQSLEAGLLVVERLRQSTEELAILHKGMPTGGVVTMSAGVTELRAPKKRTPANLTAEVDSAGCRAKNAGWNCVVTYSPAAAELTSASLLKR